MNKWKPFQYVLNLRCRLTYFQIHQRIYTNRILSSFKRPNYIFTSMVSSLFLFKVLANENKSEKFQEIIKKADYLYDETKFEELFSFLSLHQDTNDPEILWRWARAHFEKVRDVKDDKEKLLHLEEALKFVDKALEINEECWAAHKWRAILLDYVWRYKSTKERIVHSFEVKTHLQRAIELNPNDGTNYYILGEWCYTFADMPWYQRKVAAAIFASPPTSSFEEALSYFQTAEKVDPMFYSMNLLMIAKCYLKLNNKEQAAEYLKKTLNYTVKTSDDMKAHEEAKELSKSL